MVTTKSTESFTPLRAALIMAVPGATPVARPAASMTAMPVELELQVTCEVISLLVLSVNTPVALSCCATPAGTEA
ncbi:MAG: hypothetical protein V2A73_02890, partial [Pseudomonadota bacterium]